MTISAFRRQLTKKMPSFTVHATYRGDDGEKILPVGLQWDMDGTSELTYYTLSENLAQDTPESRLAIVRAHNKWAFAKELPFRRVDEIRHLSITGANRRHVQVEWDTAPIQTTFQRASKEEIRKILTELSNSQHAVSSDGPTIQTEVWINGIYIDSLSPTSLPVVLNSLEECESPQLAIHQQLPHYFRIERSFRGYIRGPQLLEHILDNLYAMEDPEIIDSSTLIGTTTLPDWVMGGELTSRLWMRVKSDGGVCFLRPRYDDDIGTSDRKYEIGANQHKALTLIQSEIERLRHLATVEHPFEQRPVTNNGHDKKEEDEENEDVRRVLQNQKINRRKRFGL